MSSKILFSPYRICPIGAHIDHQGGAVLGRTINLGSTLEYQQLDSKEIHITSDQFGKAKFSVGDLDKLHWARYAQAAARILNPKRGMQAHVTGSLIGAGLSSSASVGLAYLGIKAIIVKSVNRIFYRSSINQGLLLIVHREAVESYKSGDQVNVDFDNGKILIGSKVFLFEPLPEKLKQIIDMKGLVNFMKAL